ncbi:MAG TPA: CoA ester lyase [Casimicrobiaceae bacterium]|nr:CoA ester lyase [Casimicrobiaceae bacterium]
MRDDDLPPRFTASAARAASCTIAAMVRRSYLFVPGNRPDRYAKACATRAGAVIVDLEDAVAAAEKAAARDALAGWLAIERPVMVRVNAVDSAWFDDDLRACAHDGVAALVLPKVERADDIARVAAVCGRRPVFPLVETARGMWNVLAVAQAPNVKALLFGSLDYQSDLGTGDDDLLYARSRLVLASRVARIDPPVDGITQSVDDVELLRRDCQRARQLGFGGKLCIHPAQVDVVNRCFGPSAEDVDWAKRVVDAFARSHGNAALLDGKMIDRPVLERAEAMLAEARQSVRD